MFPPEEALLRGFSCSKTRECVMKAAHGFGSFLAEVNDQGDGLTQRRKGAKMGNSRDI
jgi:hypothetical protein